MMLITNNSIHKRRITLIFKLLLITIPIRWVGEGKKILEKVTHEASKQAPKATAAGVQHASSEDNTSSQGPAKAPSAQSGNSSTKQDSPQQMKDSFKPLSPQIKEYKSIYDNPNVHWKIQHKHVQQDLPPSSSPSELDKIQLAMKDGSWVAVEQHTTTTSTYSKPQGTTTSTSVSTNIPTPPPLPSNHSVSPTMPITDEALEKAKSKLKSADSVTNTSHHSPEGDPISGMSSSPGFSATGPLGSATQVSKTTLNVPNNQPVPHTHIRGMAAMHVGKFRPHRSPRSKDPVTASNDNTPPILGDQSGQHKVVVVAACSKTGCKDQNCATETELSTGNAKPNACEEPAEFHQQTIVDHPFIVYEYVGTFTHQQPPDIDVQEVDAVVDHNGDNQAQLVTKEAGLTPVDPASFHEKEDKTLYAQDNARTEAIIKAVPTDSILNQK